MKRSLSTAVALSLAIALFIVLSESLHLTQRSAYFVADLGGSAGSVLGAYTLFAVVTGLVVGVVNREPRAQSFILAAIYFIVISLKILWIDAGLLTVPVIGGAFAVFSIGLFAGAVFVARRLALSFVFPPLLVVIYANVCLGIATGWALAGGRLMAFLTSARTIGLVLAGALITIGSVAAQRWAEGRTNAFSRWLVPITVIVALVVATSVTSRRISTNAPAGVTATAGAPDVYVLSFDALRSDDLHAYVAAHPQSHLASLLRESTIFDNVVSHGTSTDTILANNTFASAAQVSCSSSVPRSLASAGYFTAMIYAGLGRRFEGSVCYDYYYAGDGDLLVPRFAVPALLSLASSSDAEDLRHKNLPASLLLQRLETVAQAGQPIYAYMHFLELHAPYVPVARASDSGFIARMKQFMQRCYTLGCDAANQENRALIDTARGAYLEILGEVDAAVGKARAIAKGRGRPYVMIITADHGELFGEHGGFAHGGGFVPELLDIPFVVHDTRKVESRTRCELMLSSEAIAATAKNVVGSGASYPDRDVLEWQAPPLGKATLAKLDGKLRFEVADAMRSHAGTWRNVHRELRGELPYAVGRCN